MKVVAVMEVSPTEGGGFYQGLNAVLQMKRLCADRFAFEVGIAHPGARTVLADLGIAAFDLPISLADRLRLRGATLRGLPAPVDRLLRRLPDVVPLEDHLQRRGADLAYFVAPWSRVHSLRRLPHWVTIWDLAHVEFGEFPEVAPVVRLREDIIGAALLQAGAVIVDSDQSKALICHRYGATAARVLPMPFLPSPSVDAADRLPTADVLASFGLQPGYLFYPAQFWAHKNHVRILEALKLCIARGHPLRVVFAGGDMGALRHVQAVAAALALQDAVRFLGFVDARAIRGLYEGSGGLVMPTYFGPTNLPPLEAWSLGVPVIYSRHLSAQAGDAALLADPDSAAELADAMVAVQAPDVRERLIAAGHRRLQALAQERVLAEDDLQDRLTRLQARLRCSRGARAGNP